MCVSKPTGDAAAQRLRFGKAARLSGSRAAYAFALAPACWPVVRWYIARLSDGSDEPWGLAALAAAVLFAPRRGWAEPLSTSKARLLCVLLAGYVASYRFLPPVGHALFFVTEFALIVPGRAVSFAWWFLLVLSLPIIASLQFYLGYPLRFATTALCVPLLRLAGLHVTAEGTALHWAGETVVVDAPCSGIHMAWTGLFLAATLACRGNLDRASTFRLLRRTGAIVFAANLLRAAALFCVEAGVWPSPSWAHEGIGLILFGGAAVAILFISRQRRTFRAATPASPAPLSP